MGQINRMCLFMLSLALISFGTGVDMKRDTGARESVRELVQEGEADSVVIVRRVEDVFFPAASPMADRLLYFEVTQGGTSASVGDRYSIVIDHPAVWRVFVDPEDNRIYKIFGFKAGTDFNSLVESMVLNITSHQAQWIAESYVELVYAANVKIVSNMFEVRRFIEDEFYAVFEPENFERGVASWVKEQGPLLLDEIRSSGVTPVEQGFLVSLFVCKATTRAEVQPEVQVRRLRLRIDKSGRVSIAEDDLVARLRHEEAAHPAP